MDSGVRQAQWLVLATGLLGAVGLALALRQALRPAPPAERSAASQAQALRQHWRDDGLALIHETVLHELTPRELARQLCNKLADHVQVPACALYEYAFVLRDDSMIQHLALKRLGGRNGEGMRFPELLHVAGPVLHPLLKAGRLLRNADIPAEGLRELEGLAPGSGAVAHHYLVVPFEFEGEVRGVMVFRAFTPVAAQVDDLMIPGAAAIGVALESAQSRDNLFASLLDSQHLANQLQENQVQLQHSQASLEEKIQHVNGIFDSMQSGLIVVDSHARIQDCNPALLALTGRTREALIGRPCGDLFENDALTLEAFMQDLGARLEMLVETSPHEAEALFQTVPLACLRLDERMRVTRANPRAVSLLGYMKEELRQRTFPDLAADDEARARLRRLLDADAGPVGMAAACHLRHKDGEALAFEVGRVWHRLRGAPGSLVFLRSDRDLPWTVFCPTLLHRLSREEDDALIARLIHRERESLPVRVTASFNPGHADMPEQTVINLNDVSSLIHKNAQIQAQNSLLERTMEAMQDGVLQIDREGMVVSANPKSMELLGASRAQVVGRALRDLLAPAGDDALLLDGLPAHHQGLMRQLLSLDASRLDLQGLGLAAEELQAQAMAASQNVEWSLARPGGDAIPVVLTAAPLRDSEGLVTGAVITIKDMREIKEKESENLEMVKKVEQSQRLDALGQLAAGVAHDFNNLLGVIQNHAELVEMKLGPDSKAARNLSAILQATTRARDIVIKLNGLGRVQPQAEVEEHHPVGSFELAPLLEETKSLLQASLKGIDIVLDPDTLGAAAVPLKGDSGSLQQVLVNLCVNASHAIGERRNGRIVIGARRPAPGQVQVDVVDNGSGIPPEVLPRIFEPFFTTKEVGKGTGLGLAMVRSIVTKMGGSIDCRSTLGEGSTFSVTLPHAG
ncbi:PAS domain S-box protein [Ramlibacter sp. MAHUQ-53]|uniref:PAS domain-containing sensor histidine kinase n=1 Tax=unclassified Ramlibacter TaxID=2617605 RepID=UPI003633C9E8